MLDAQKRLLGGGLGLLAAALVLQPAPADACTTFYFDQDGPTVGKSYDWDIDYGLVFVNKRGMQKTALVTTPGDSGAQWTSSYGSLTFNQYGREFPNSGMNEAGLVVEIMWLNETEYPAQDGRPVVNELQWIQYALDNFATVSELAAAAPDLRISPAFAEVHYLVCDAGGACGAFEYLDGDLVLSTGSDMLVDGKQVRTLANDTYADSIDFLAQHQGFGGDDPIPESTSSLDRFVRASVMTQEEPGESLPDSALAILDSVSQGSYSVWNLIHRPDDGEVFFRTYQSPNLKSIDLGAFDLDCTSEVMMLDIHHEPAGDVTAELQPYDADVNLNLIENSLAPIIEHLPEGAVTLVATYPQTATHCTLGTGGAGGEGGAGGSSGAGGGGASSAEPTTDSDSDDSCAMSPAGAGSSSAGAAWALALGLALWRVRRRR